MRDMAAHGATGLEFQRVFGAEIRVFWRGFMWGGGTRISEGVWRDLLVSWLASAGWVFTEGVTA